MLTRREVRPLDNFSADINSMLLGRREVRPLEPFFLLLGSRGWLLPPRATARPPGPGALIIHRVLKVLCSS